MSDLTNIVFPSLRRYAKETVQYLQNVLYEMENQMRCTFQIILVIFNGSQNNYLLRCVTLEVPSTFDLTLRTEQ